jgi:hypothetical protein
MMEETNGTAAAPNRMILILLVVIVALLGVIIAIVVLGGNDTPATDTAADANFTGTGTSTGMGTSTGTSAEVAFDPATATRVAAGLTPEQHVATYFDAVVAGDYATAFAMLPTSKQAEYGDEAAFAEQLAGYGVTDYAIDDVTEADGETQVIATANMPGGAFQYLWTFVKDGEEWLVKSRTLPGMGQ